MIISKVLALSLLLSSSLILSRVQLNSTIEIYDSSRCFKDILDQELKIDAHKSIILWEGDIIIKVSIIDEQDDFAIVEYEIYVENDAFQYELIAAPAVVAEYGIPASVRFGDYTEDEELRFLKVSVVVNKIE